MGRQKTHMLGIGSQIILSDFRHGCIFRKCVLPGGLAELLEIVRMFQFLALIDCTMVLPISTCTFDATNTPDAFKQVPDLVWRAPGRLDVA